MSFTRLIEQIDSLLSETDMEEDTQTKIINTLNLVDKDIRGLYPDFQLTEVTESAMVELDVIIDDMLDGGDENDEDEDWDEDVDEDEEEDEEV